MIKTFIDWFKKKLETTKWLSPAVAVFAFLIVLLFSFTRPYELFELTLYDLRFNIKPPIAEWDKLTFLNIDDHSINSAGEFPWPRYIYSRGKSTLHEAGVSQITYDIQFLDASPRIVDQEAYNMLQERIGKGEVIDIESLEQAIVDSDRVFASSLRSNGSSVLAYSFSRTLLPDWYVDEETRKERREAELIFTERASIPLPEDRVDQFEFMIDPDRVQIQYPIPPLVRGAQMFGFVDSDFDIDGASRKIRLVRVFDNRIYFNLALTMVMDLCGVAKENVEVYPGRHVLLKDALNPVTYEKGDIAIPVNEQGMMYINWVGTFEESFNHLSYYALLEYPLVRDEIHSFFDEEEMRSGGSERTSLYGSLFHLENTYEAAEDLSEKAEIRRKIEDARTRIHEIERSYAQPLIDEKNEIKNMLKKGDDPELRDILLDIETYLTAVNIVLGVEKLYEHSVLIGLTGTATHDIGVTPLSSEYVMAGSYHNIANTILQEKFIREVPPAVNYVLMFILALSMGFFMQQLSAKRSLMVFFGSFVFVNVIVIALFSFVHVWVEQLGISLAIILPSLFIAGVKFVSEESQKRFIKSAFSHYLSPAIIDEIVKNPDSLQLGGELRNITIYFSDVAGFSTISEKLNPQELVTLLNEYLSEMTDIILSYNGTIDKYEGDAIIAFYGAPLPFDDHAIKACLSVIDMKRRLAELRESWRARGQDELIVRVGMNTGDAVVGNMGSRTRMDYTMMGDAVNLAARLEGANKFYGTYTMITDTTYNAAKDYIDGRELDIIRVVGKEQPITVYELLGRKDQLSGYMYEMLEKYNEGLMLFRERDWQGARNAFRKAVKIVEDDGPSLTYIERCDEFIKKPPSKSWDGVYRLKTK